MTLTAPEREAEEVAGVEYLPPVRRHCARANGEAYLSLSQAQRRLSHRYRGWAAEAEKAGDLADYANCMLRAKRLWREAKWHLERARDFLHATKDIHNA
jgi:hypothetical protein